VAGLLQNFIVISAQPIDVPSYGGEEALAKLKADGCTTWSTTWTWRATPAFARSTT